MSVDQPPPDPSRPHRGKAATELDATLRRVLEPHSADVARVVRGALAQRPAALVAPWAWAGAAVALTLLVAIPFLTPDAPPVPSLRPHAETMNLVISNESGLVTVTSPAGSKMIILPGEKS